MIAKVYKDKRLLFGMEMDKEKVKEKIERWKLAAEIFLKEDVRVYIKDVSEDIYFADILFVGDNAITIQCFAPQQRKNKKYTLYWYLISDFDKYDRGGND